MNMNSSEKTNIYRSDELSMKINLFFEKETEGSSCAIEKKSLDYF